MDVNSLINKGAIWIEKIEDGFLTYHHNIVEGTETEVYDYVKELVLRNGYENTYVDFYYGKLTEEAKDKVREVLSIKQLEYLDSFDTSSSIYFPLTSELFEIVFHLSITDTLFSTFYFCKEPCTIWSNYEKTWVVFRN